MTDTQTLILQHLLHNEQFLRDTAAFIEREYFGDFAHAKSYDLIKSFFDKYNTPPTAEAIKIEMANDESIPEARAEEVWNKLSEVLTPPTETSDYQWLLDTTEKWCQDQALYNGVMESIQIMNGDDPKRTKESIPTILQDALGVCFDTRVGHDYIEDALQRYQYYHEDLAVVTTDLEMLNKITPNGFPRKTLNIAMASTGVGKSMLMCSLASGILMRGYNVLYITMEMAEHRIAERIDANLMDVELDQLKDLPRDMFMKKVDQLNEKVQGNLIIREYPTGSAHVGHFRHLLNELNTKRKIKPDIIFIDYLNICASSRMKFGGSVNSYSYIKSIAEELRGLAVEFDVPVVSATQTNRDGYNNSDVDLSNTSESFGLPATADLLFALIATEELDKMGQLLVKQLKNRYADPSRYNRFTIGVDKAKMRMYDLDNATDNLTNSGGTDDGIPPWEDDSSDPLNSFGKRDSPDFGTFKI